MTIKYKIEAIHQLEYTRPAIEQGYANQTLSIDISQSDISIQPLSEQIKEIFIGGKGFDLWLLWNAVHSKTKWNDPENAICIASGPMGGTPIYPGSGKSIVTTISPLTGSVIDSNVGGYFGPYLKFSGFDALEVKGKTSKDVIIFIDGIEEKIQILKTSGLPDESYDLSAILTDHFGKGKPRNISVVSTGPGAKNTRIGCLNFTWYDLKRKRARYKQAGRGGIGSVFADKRIKAIVTRWDSVKVDTNNPADVITLKAVGRKHTREIVELDPKQNEMAKIGTTHLVSIMNDFDLLPVNNFQYGQHPETDNVGQEVYRRIFDSGFDGCWMGCSVACSHGVKDFVPLTGPYKGTKVFVDGPEYETIAGCGSNIGVFDPHTIIEMNFYCDTYGLDTISVGTATAFAMECFEMDLINERHTGGMDLSFGNRLAALEILHHLISCKISVWKRKGSSFQNI